jgi:hypothetical protein
MIKLTNHEKLLWLDQSLLFSFHKGDFHFLLILGQFVHFVEFVERQKYYHILNLNFRIILNYEYNY